MQKHLTVVLQDQTILNEVFGANDGNLSVLEDLFGVRIFSKGNEIFLESDDSGLQRTFQSVMGQLQEHVKLGQQPGPDLIRAIWSTVQSGEPEKTETLKDTQVIIPNGLRKVFPRSWNQAMYLKAIEEKELVFGVGPAGTGKTYLAIAQALKAVISRAKRKLILTRPVVESGESLGFLPGDLIQKVSPYLRPLYDAMENLVPPEAIRRLEEHRVIEVAPLAYMRGRTLADCFVILDEAQNTTREQMKMFLTRIGEGSRTVVTGDITQIDLPRKSESGLLNVIPILRPIPDIRFTFFEAKDVVRNELVRKIVHAYEAAEQE